MGTCMYTCILYYIDSRIAMRQSAPVTSHRQLIVRADAKHRNTRACGPEHALPTVAACCRGRSRRCRRQGRLAESTIGRCRRLKRHRPSSTLLQIDATPSALEYDDHGVLTLQRANVDGRHTCAMPSAADDQSLRPPEGRDRNGVEKFQMLSALRTGVLASQLATACLTDAPSVVADVLASRPATAWPADAGHGSSPSECATLPAGNTKP